MTLANAWEQNARDWIAWVRTPGQDEVFWQGTWPLLREIIPAAEGLVLDLGCGEGRVARLLGQAGQRVIGVERSPTLIRAAAAGSPPVTVVLADGATLPIVSNSISVVVACMSLLDIDDFGGAISETARVLHPGGQFCMAVPHPFDTAGDPQLPDHELFRFSRPYQQPRRYEDHFERDGLAISIVSMHRPLSAYTAALFSNKMVITELREGGNRNLPGLLAIRAEKRD
jgi:SAM-dependent methyltransferase